MLGQFRTLAMFLCHVQETILCECKHDFLFWETPWAMDLKASSEMEDKEQQKKFSVGLYHIFCAAKPPDSSEDFVVEDDEEDDREGAGEDQTGPVDIVSAQSLLQRVADICFEKVLTQGVNIWTT